MAENTGKIKTSTFNRGVAWEALRDSLYKLNPRLLWHNPVMFVVEIGAVLTTFFIHS